MLNGYVFFKKLHEKEVEASKIRVRSLRPSPRRTEKMLENYNTRVAKFVQEMLKEPIVVKSELRSTSAIYPNSSPTKKYMGSPKFVINRWKSERERIAEAVQKYKVMQTEPIRVSRYHCFRQRDPSKDIQPKMKFCISPSHTKYHFTPSGSLSANTSLSSLNEERKNLKLHFKGAIEVLTRGECRMKARPNEEKHEIDESADERQPLKGILKHDSSISPKKTIRFSELEEKLEPHNMKVLAKNMLVKCNVFGRKSSYNAKTLHKGEGLMASTMYSRDISGKY